MLLWQGVIGFGKGSRVIITTRNVGVLGATKVDCTYELTCMDFDHCLQLFSRHASRRDYPSEEYILVSIQAVNFCDGLPLALEVIGSFLSGQNITKRNTILTRLENFPYEKLMISIEALDS